VLKPWQCQRAFVEEMEKKGMGDFQPPEAPWLPLTTQVWRIISAILENFKDQLRVVEHACRAIRFLIRSMGIQSIIFVEELAHQMMRIYSIHPHSCFLYLASILVDEYGSVSYVQNGLITMLNVLAKHSFAILQGPNALRDHPDTVDDLFRLAIRFVQRCPEIFFREAVSETLFEGALHGLELDHTDANRSVSKFITESLKLGKENRGNAGAGTTAAEHFLTKYGEQLVWQNVNSALFLLSYPLRKDMAEIVFLIGQLNRQKLSESLTAAIQRLPHDSGLTPTRQQLLGFHEAVLSATKSYEVVNAIRELSRYYN